MKNHFTALLLLLTVLVTGCKEKSEEVDPVLKTDGASLQLFFESEGHLTRLVDRVNDTLQVRWKPEWSGVVSEKVNDSTYLAYVALVPGIYHTQLNEQISNGNVQGYSRYLMFRATKNYTAYLATFYNNAILNTPVDRDRFTGRVIFRNMLTAEWKISEYENGKLVSGWEPR